MSDTKPTIFELIQNRVACGYEFATGHHQAGLRGHWACFIHVEPDERETCDDCGEPAPVLWEQCGHHLTLIGAFRAAYGLSIGDHYDVPTPKSFE
jgi:hypothetical protein